MAIVLFAPRRHLAARAHAARAVARLVWLLGRPIVVDTETTDFDGEIIEFAVVDGRTSTLLFSSLVRPSGPINPEAAAKHHISDAMCAEAPTWQEIWPQVAPLLRWRVICAWNAPFDRGRVAAACRSAGARMPTAIWWCLMRAESATRRDGWRQLDSGHRAVDDARAAQRVLSKLAGGPRRRAAAGGEPSK